MAESIVGFFKVEENMYVIEKLKKAGVNTVQEKNISHANKPLEGLTFVITGTLKNYTRTGITELLTKYGGKVSSALSGKTDYLIAGENPGSKLQKAERLHVRIIDEDELEKIIKKGTENS